LSWQAFEAAARTGATDVRTHKDKSTELEPYEMEVLLKELLIGQDERCAYTGIEMLDDSQEPDWRRASLDRIDSSRGHELDNLQLVCRFVNQMKRDTPDPEFRLYLDAIRAIGPR